MIAETNMLGFNQSLHKQTSYVNQVSFAGGVSHGREFSFPEQVHSRTPDCILIVGSDPFSTLPQSLMSRLQGVDIICLDHFSTLTTEVASVVIPTAVPGVESGGNVVRMDGDRHRAGAADQERISDTGRNPQTTAGEGAAMTSPQNGIRLTIVTHEDVHLSIVKLRDGWGDAYQKKAAIVRIAPADVEKLGLKDNARVELTSPAGSVVVTAKSDATCEAGMGLMPSSLYTNRLASYDPGSRCCPASTSRPESAPTEKGITPVSDLMVRRNRA